jgi:hypothetical protein
MRTCSDLFRLIGLVAIATLLADPTLVQGAWGQSSPPLPPLVAAPGTSTTADPPARVGRLALVTGIVSFHTAADTDWSPASLNYPVATGDSFWTQPDAEADLELGGTRIDMAATTEVDLNTLDASGTNATLPQGEIYIDIRALMPNETVTLETPRGTVIIATPGQYDVVAGDTADPTVVTVVTGAAQVTGTDLTLNVGSNQAATLTGTDTFQGSVGPEAQDAFLSAMLAREQATAPAPGSAAPPLAIVELPGGEDLTTVGTWATAPNYGEVWYPPVLAGWVPYRDGHWAYVAPWGWTWVDADPWGFAPFHYGRWAHIGDRWGWLPGVEARAVARPVYAPALVTFFGVGAGVAIGGSVGWCPLAPGEVYHPWYHASERYVREVNVHVTNVTNITRVTNVTIDHYRNAHFATVVPAATLADSRPVAREARPVSVQELAAAHPVVDREPLRPTARTAGVTPAVARQLHIETPRGAPAPRAAPGPAVHPVAQTQAGRPRVVPLRPPVKPAAARPGQPVEHPAETSHGPTPPAPGHPTPAVVHPGSAERPAEPPLRPGGHVPPAAEHPAAARPGQPVEHPAGTSHGPAPSAPVHPSPAVVHPVPTGHPAEPARSPQEHVPPAAEHPATARPAAPGEHPAEAPHHPTPSAPAHPTPSAGPPVPTEHPAEPARRTEEHAPPAAEHPAAARPALPVEHPAEVPHRPEPSAPHPAPPPHRAPEAHPAATPHPAPQAHPAPPPRPEEKKPEEKKSGQP